MALYEVEAHNKRKGGIRECMLIGSHRNTYLFLYILQKHAWILIYLVNDVKWRPILHNVFLN
jgi:hypothetical protein